MVCMSCCYQVQVFSDVDTLNWQAPYWHWCNHSCDKYTCCWARRRLPATSGNEFGEGACKSCCMTQSLEARCVGYQHFLLPLPLWTRERERERWWDLMLIHICACRCARRLAHLRIKTTTEILQGHPRVKLEYRSNKNYYIFNSQSTYSCTVTP